MPCNGLGVKSTHSHTFQEIPPPPINCEWSFNREVPIWPIDHAKIGHGHWFCNLRQYISSVLFTCVPHMWVCLPSVVNWPYKRLLKFTSWNLFKREHSKASCSMNSIKVWRCMLWQGVSGKGVQGNGAIQGMRAVAVNGIIWALGYRKVAKWPVRSCAVEGLGAVNMELGLKEIGSDVPCRDRLGARVEKERCTV